MQKKEQLHLIKGKDRISNETSSNRFKMQQDNNFYILTGPILNQNFQENQKMQKHICYVPMTG